MSRLVFVFALAVLVGASVGLITVGGVPAVTSYVAANFSKNGIGPSSPRASSPWDETYFPNLPVVSHDGQTYRFYDDLIRDKMVVVNFIYTSCSNICPLATARLRQVKDLLGDRVGRDIFFYSITIDPAVDGPEVLKTYAETFGADAGKGWMFLTGKPEDIEVIRAKLGERSRSKAEHRNDVMLGNGRTGSWGRDSAFSDIEVLAENIRRLDPEWRNRVRPVSPNALVSASTHFRLDESPGSGLFAKACAGCHTIGYGDGIGPDLAGVRERRDAAWLRRFLREPDLLRAEQDPIAVGLDAKFPGVRMPNLGLSDLDVDDLLAYFEAEQLRVRAAKAALGGQIPPAAAPASH